MMQRLAIATIVGDAADVVTAFFRGWQTRPPDAATADHFCEQLRANSASLPIVYYCEWIDRWLMGNLVPGPGAVEGKRFQFTCMSAEQAVAWAERCGNQFLEQEWLARRLREAAEGWGAVAETKAIIVTREMLSASTTDDEVRASLCGVPTWLVGHTLKH
jgi:hypothetical protein